MAFAVLIAGFAALGKPPGRSVQGKQKAAKLPDGGIPPMPGLETFLPFVRPDGGAYEKFSWDVPDIIEDVPVQGPLMSAGIPIKAHAVRTTMHGRAIVDYFVERFGNSGLVIIPPKTMVQLTALPQLTAYDPLERISYTVMFQANPDSTTTLILTEANLALREPMVPGSGISHPSNVARLLRSSAEGVETTTYATNLKPADLLAHYEPQLAKQGLRHTDDGHFEGATGAVDVMFEPLRDGGTAVVYVRRLPAAAHTPAPDAQP